MNFRVAARFFFGGIDDRLYHRGFSRNRGWLFGNGRTTMSQHNKERHKAAMLVHGIGSGIEALNDVPTNILIENFDALVESASALHDILIRACNIEEAKKEQLRAHQ